MRNAVVLAVLSTAVACAHPPAPLAPELLARDIAAPPAAVQTAAARVLASHGFPLAPIAPATGIVQSQQLEVTGTWDGVPVMDRVDCGRDVGQPRAKANPVQLTLSIITTPAASGTRVQLKPVVTGYDQMSRSLAASDPGAAASAGTYTCNLTPAFIEQLMQELTTAAAH